MLSFLLVVARDGAPVDEADLARMRAAVRPLLGYEPRSEIAWMAPFGRRVSFCGWDAHREGWPAGTRWYVDAEGLTAFSGLPLPSGTAWKDGSWARALHALRARGRSAAEDCWGVFSVVHLATDGAGVVHQDPLSMSGLYRGRMDRYELISNRPEVIAAAAGSYHRRDPWSVGWFVAAHYMYDESTSFEGVRAVEADTVVEISSAAGPVVERFIRDDPWSAQPPPFDEALDRLANDLQAHMLSVAELGVPVTLTLSGGHDSRLVLAMALSMGLDRSLSCMTMELNPGEVDPDLIAATMLADRYALDHHVIRIDKRQWTSAEFEHRLRTHASVTAAMLHGKGLLRRMTVLRGINLNGNFGELYKDGATGHSPVGTLHEAYRVVSNYLHGGPAVPGLLRLDAKGQYRSRTRDIVDRLVDLGTPIDHVPYRMDPLRGIGPWMAAEQRVRAIHPNVHPLYSAHARQVARAAGWHARRLHRIHFELMRRFHADIATVPFANKGWPEALLPTVDDGARFGAAPIKRARSRQSHKGFRWRDHVEVFRKYLLEDSSNPIHSIIDRRTVEDVLAERQSIPPGGIPQLLGALGAAIWLGQHELQPAEVTLKEIDAEA